MKRFIIPIGIAVVIFVGWLVYALSQVSIFHELQKLQITSVKQFGRPTSGLFQMSDGRMAYEWSVDGKREITGEGTINHVYVPYEDPQTKNVVALVEINGESAADLHPQAYTEKVVLTQVQGLVYPYDTIEPAVLNQYQADNGAIPPGTPLLVMGDSALDPQPAILHAGILAFVLMILPFGVVLLMNRPKPTRRPRDDYERYAPTWRKK